MSTDLIEAPATMQTMLREYVELETRRRDLEDELKVVGDKSGKLAEMLLEQFADAGMQNAKVGDLTVYIRTDRYCSKKSEFTTEYVCGVLKEVGLGYMVADSYNASSLKSKIKEYIDQTIEIPEPLKQCLNIGETLRLATRKS